MAEITAKPFLRWAGSKRKLLPILKSYWNNTFDRYIEPFAGSACLFFEIMPPKALLGDTNKLLVETYNSIKKYPELVHEKAMDIPYGKDTYYTVRSLDTDSMSPVEIAARFLYLNRYCFNGLYRTNASGKFNVPFASSKTGNIPNLQAICAASIALKNAKIINTDFLKLIKRANFGDFVYLDPPYAVKNSSIFSQYGAETFGLNDLQRLAKSLFELHNRNVKFVLSYANVEEAHDLFKTWDITIVKTQRNIAGFSKFRRVEEELIVSNI